MQVVYGTIWFTSGRYARATGCHEPYEISTVQEKSMQQSQGAEVSELPCTVVFLQVVKECFRCRPHDIFWDTAQALVDIYELESGR